MITTEAMVAETPKKSAPAMPGGGGMGGMDYEQLKYEDRLTFVSLSS